MDDRSGELCSLLRKAARVGASLLSIHHTSCCDADRFVQHSSNALRSNPFRPLVSEFQAKVLIDYP